MPHWPSPWGRDAAAVEQLVIDEELAEAGVVRPHLGVGAWALPAIIAHGIRASSASGGCAPPCSASCSWCQLFSEPGAGSDLASLTTRAERVDGGWLLTGQKVWTSMARESDWGICLARTDPTAPKHEGITYFIVDMRSPGLDIRPLRELTGDAMFNEVFLDDVFVPDDCVIGEVDGGWKMARTTLANERVSMSSGSTFGIGVESLLRLAERRSEPVSPGTSLRLGRAAGRGPVARPDGPPVHAAVAGRRRSRAAGPACASCSAPSTSSGCRSWGWPCSAPRGRPSTASAKRWAHGFLVTRCLTIAGGHQRDPAQRHRRAPARPAPRSRTRDPDPGRPVDRPGPSRRPSVHPLGRPSTRSPTRVRWISLVPAKIDDAW